MICVLFRNDGYKTTNDEEQTCMKYFQTYNFRAEVPECSLVIGRYSCLPFYYELNCDLQYRGSQLINTYNEHEYIANFDYYYDLEKYTPKTYFDASEAYSHFKEPGMFLRGRTNSAKYLKYSLAKTRKDFFRIDSYLYQHETISYQGIVYREYVPLEIIEESIIPESHNFVNEWRCFFYKETLLEYGYYWSMASDEGIEKANKQDLSGMLELANEIAQIVSKRTTFFVLDIAKTQEGKWILIEINDGQMSGTAMCNIDKLYNNLAKACHDDKNRKT